MFHPYISLCLTPCDGYFLTRTQYFAVFKTCKVQNSLEFTTDRDRTSSIRSLTYVSCTSRGKLQVSHIFHVQTLKSMYKILQHNHQNDCC